jgi:hypothetical protein
MLGRRLLGVTDVIVHIVLLRLQKILLRREASEGTEENEEEMRGGDSVTIRKIPKLSH